MTTQPAMTVTMARKVSILQAAQNVVEIHWIAGKRFALVVNNKASIVDELMNFVEEFTPERATQIHSQHPVNQRPLMTEG